MNDYPDRSEVADMEANPLSTVPVEISVCVGRAQPILRDLLSLDIDAILELDRNLDDPVELYVGERLIGYGVLEVREDDSGEGLSVRITRMADLAASVRSAREV